MYYYALLTRCGGDLVTLRLFNFAESAIIYRDAYCPDAVVQRVNIKEVEENES